MSDELTNVPRRLRRFYRHGEPVPEGMDEKSDSNPVKEGENHEENEPWMNAPPAPRSTSEPKRGNARRENARAPAHPSSANQNTDSAPKQGLFSRILHRESKPVVTPMDHALGLHEKEKFVEQTPRGSERALRQTPPAPSQTPANVSPAASDIQKTLQELKTLAKTNASAEKSSVSLTSFHFTPVGEAPRPPESHERVTQYPPEKGNENLSPRERAEQRRQGRGNAPAPTSTLTTASSAPVRANTPAQPVDSAHIRRRMGQLVDNERMDRDEEPVSRSASPADEKDDEDFKSLFSDSKTKGTDKEKKKKKASADDDDLSLDDDSDADLELFEDDK